MEKTAFDTRYQEYLKAIEEYLNGLFAEKPHWADLYEAMRYSLLSGGKRLRPVMTLEFARLCGLDWHSVVPVGCALELVHTYSLIHDDLPCMDDEAYRLILTAPGLTDAQRADCALILANASGADGMVAGQVLDTLHSCRTEPEVAEVHHLKTGAMIAGACMLGVAAAGGSDAARKAAEEYGYQLGLAFQIRDEMLDVIGDAGEFGKPIGSDREEGKVTYVDLLGLDNCDKLVHELTEKAVAAVSDLDRDGFLTALAESLTERKK